MLRIAEIIGLIAGIFIGFSAFYGIWGAIKFTVDKAFGRKLVSFRYMTFRWNNTSGFYKSNFTPLCEIITIKPNEPEALTILEFIIENVIFSAISVSFIMLTISLSPKFALLKLCHAIMYGMSLWAAAHIVIMIFCTIKIFAESKNSLRSYTSDIIDKITAGVPMDEIDVPDHRSLNCKATNFDLSQYLHFAFINRIWHSNFDDLEFIVSSTEKCLKLDRENPMLPYELLTHELPASYILLFYYSCIKPDIQHAIRIYCLIEDDLLNDKDSNGYRTLAYYTYFVLKDKEKTREYITEGLRMLDEFPLISQREVEEMLLKKLLNALDGEQKQTYFELCSDVQIDKTTI